LPPPAGYFEKIQKVLNKYGILFVADEVICGFGRTGNLWGTQTYDLKPDIITCAKGLSAAMQPISAVLLNDMIFDVMVSESDRIGAFVHGYTYAGHPVASSVALEVLKIYEEMDIVGHVRSLETRFLGILDELSRHPIAASPGGAGLLGGFEIVADKEARTSFPADVDIAGRLDEAAQAEGLILRIASDRVAFSPPLIISEPELDEMAEKTYAAMDTVHRSL
jgi:4-aminobutyrate--pyruvate transaminase